jgi:hypothetical protein
LKPSSLICFSFLTYSIKIYIHCWNVLIFTTALTKFTEHWINFYTLRFILLSKVVMCKCWQNVFYVLSIAILKWGMGREKSPSSPNNLICLIPSQYYLLLGLPPFSHPRGISVCLQSLYYDTSAIPGIPYHPRLHNPKNLKFNFYLIRQHIVMVRGWMETYIQAF